MTCVVAAVTEGLGRSGSANHDRREYCKDECRSGTCIWGVVLLISYVLSFGPACWLTERGTISFGHLTYYYRPCVLGVDAADRCKVFGLLRWYATVGVDRRPAFLERLRSQLFVEGVYGPVR